MSFYIYGIVFIPIALWVFFWHPKYLIPLLVAASVFETSPLVSFPIGSSIFEIKPYYFVAILVAIRAWPLLFNRLQLEIQSGPYLAQIMRSFVSFWKWSVLSAFLFPVLFQGVRVIDPRAIGGDVVAAFLLEGASDPLHLKFENFGQAFYLTLNLVAFLYICSEERGDKRALPLKTLKVTILVVSLIAVAQFVAAKKGWSIPFLDFESQLTYAGSTSFDSDNVRRVNATLSEPSTASGFLAAGSLGLLASRFTGGTTSLAAIALASLALLLTTAATGYAALVGSLLLFVVYLSRASVRKRIPRKILWRSFLSAAVLSAAILAFVVADPTLRQAAIETTFEKSDTVSFVARGAADAYSFKLLASTYGLGTGLGSNRPSGFGAALLGNVGIVGVTLFVIFLVRLFRQLFAGSRGPYTSSFAMATWTLLGMLVAQLLALPDLSWPPFWGVLFAALSLLVSHSDRSTEVVFAGVRNPLGGSSPADPARA
jgi:hypothetical protein